MILWGEDYACRGYRTIPFDPDRNQPTCENRGVPQICTSVRGAGSGGVRIFDQNGDQFPGLLLVLDILLVDVPVPHAFHAACLDPFPEDFGSLPGSAAVRAERGCLLSLAPLQRIDRSMDRRCRLERPYG